MSQDTDPNHPSSLLDRLARLRAGASRSTLRQLLSDGRVSVNGRTVKVASTPIGAADRVEIHRARAEPPPNLGIPIVYEDEHLLIVNKPAGLLSSTVPSEKRPTAIAMVRDYAARVRPEARVGLIHRLDRDASGLMVFGMSQRALASLKKQFADHTAERVYAVIIHGAITPADGTIESRLVEHSDGTVHRTDHPKRGESAITHYRSIAQQNGLTLLRVTLETGRKHQIRAHLADRGFPIVGDSAYAGAPAPRLMLAAIELSLDHPATGKRLHFKTDLPEPLAKLLR